MMNRDEALEYVSDYVWWPNVNDHAGKLQHVPTGWSWWNGDAGIALVHTVHDPITRTDWERARSLANPTPTAEPAPNKYQRIVPSTTIDVYDVLHAYSVTNPATQHAVKKLLQPGNRGHKDTLTDLREALASIQRAIQIEEQSTRG